MVTSIIQRTQALCDYNPAPLPRKHLLPLQHIINYPHKYTQIQQPPQEVSDPNDTKLCERRMIDGPHFSLPSSYSTNGEVDKIYFVCFCKTVTRPTGFGVRVKAGSACKILDIRTPLYRKSLRCNTRLY